MSVIRALSNGSVIPLDYDHPIYLWEESWYAFFALGFGSLLWARESRRTYILQVALFVLVAVVSAGIITPRELGGDLTMVLALFLAYKYGLVVWFPRRFAAAMLALLIAARVAGGIAFGILSFTNIALQTILVAAWIYALHWVFEQELIETREHRDKIIGELDRAVPFVEFGRNVSGVIHDFKNDASLFAAFAAFLRQSIGEPITADTVERLGRYVQRLNDRVGRIMLATHARDEAGQRFDLVAAVKASLYVFEANLELRRMVRISLTEPSSPVYLAGNMSLLISILENVIRNSCDAMTDQTQSEALPPELRVSVRMEESGAVIRIEDNGPGFSFCRKCQSNCLDCPEIQAGRTTKAHGSGVGLLRVKSAAAQLGVEVSIANRLPRGVVAEIRCPLAMIVASSEQPIPA